MAAPCTVLQCSFSAKTAVTAAMPTAMQAQYIVHATAKDLYEPSKGSMQSAAEQLARHYFTIAWNVVPNAHSDRSGINYHAINLEHSLEHEEDHLSLQAIHNC